MLQFGVVERIEREVGQRTEKELHATLEKMAGELSLIINHQKSIASGLSRVPSVRSFASVITNQNTSKATYQRAADELESFFLNYQHSVSSIQAIRFIDTDGKTLVKIKEGKPIEPKLFDTRKQRLYVSDQSPKRFYQDAVKEAHAGGVVMSDFELGQVTFGADFCPAMIRYTVPIRDEIEQIHGYLVVNMWGQRLDSIVETALGGYPAKTYIVELSQDKNRDGIYLYHAQTEKRFANQMKTNFRFDNELELEEWYQVKAAKAGDVGSIFKRDGQMFFYKVMAPFADRNTYWLLVIEAQGNKVFESIYNLRESIWLLLGGLLIISLLLAIYASGRLSLPVNRLAEVIRNFADGDRGVRYKGAVTDEVGMAGKAFNYLATTLEKTEQEREKAVRAACQSERLAALGQLAAGIGHEINNPLMNIMSLATLVEESLPEADAETINDLKIMRKEGERCARIIQGILNFARENEPSYKPFDMAALIEETLELLHHRIESGGIKVQVELDKPMRMEGDEGMLQQVLVNILLNAVQASPLDTTIHVSGKMSGGSIVIEILDEGEGIKGTNFSKIFDPFFTTKSEGEGTGLGLSVSYGIIKHHGGTISIENTNHAGVKVVITLPVKTNRDEMSTEYLEARNVG